VASEKYPLQAAQRKMLEAVQGKIEEARGSDPWRYEARLSVDQVGTIGEEIGLEELDAVEMFHRLWQEEFFVACWQGPARYGRAWSAPPLRSYHQRRAPDHEGAARDREASRSGRETYQRVRGGDHRGEHGRQGRHSAEPP
jgi:hypothetical protein